MTFMRMPLLEVWRFQWNYRRFRKHISVRVDNAACSQTPNTGENHIGICRAADLGVIIDRHAAHDSDRL